MCEECGAEAEHEVEFCGEEINLCDRCLGELIDG
jgi:hypothetical protein